jgi:two-component sensor histidine kinase
MMGAGRELSGRRNDASEFPVEIGLNPVHWKGDAAVLATVIDITERQRALEGQKLVIRELQHRTQNLFAVFQVIAARSFDEGKTVAEIKNVLIGRLQALAGAYAMLTDRAWEGYPLLRFLGVSSQPSHAAQTSADVTSSLFPRQLSNSR